MTIPASPARSESVGRLAEERWKAVLDNPYIGVAIVGPDRQFVETNARFQSLVGYSDEELRRMTMLEITHPDDLAASLKSHDAIRSGSVRDVHGLHLEVRDDGEGIEAARIADSRSFGLLGMRERARAYDGNCVIAPHPEGGTLVTASIPHRTVRNGSDHRKGGQGNAPHSRRR